MDKPRLLDQVRDALRVRHYSLRTEASYLQWIRRFILYHNKRHPLEMGEQEITGFLTHLAVNKHVAPSTQNQALAAILFLYKEGRFQVPSATLAGLGCSSRRCCSNTSCGVAKPRTRRGRVLSRVAMRLSSRWFNPERSVPLGRYWRKSPLVFSLVPRCHGLCGSAK